MTQRDDIRTDQVQTEQKREPLFARSVRHSEDTQTRRQSLFERQPERPSSGGIQKHPRLFHDETGGTKKRPPVSHTKRPATTQQYTRATPTEPLFDMNSRDNQRQVSRPDRPVNRNLFDKDTSLDMRTTSHAYDEAADARLFKAQQEYHEINTLRNHFDYNLAKNSHLEMPFEMWRYARPRSFSWSNPLILTTIIIVSVIILILFAPIGAKTQISYWIGPLMSKVLPISAPMEPPLPVGDYHLQGPSSLTAEEIDIILGSYGSPATGTGKAWVEIGRKHNIDPAYAIAFFIHESTAGTHPQWAGKKPDGSTTYNIGNIICAGYPTCHGRFRDYNSWEEGIEDWFRLIEVEYIEDRGTKTVDEILPIYAPAFENDVQAYVSVVKRMVDGWRTGSVRGRNLPGITQQPTGNPLQASNTVMTQDYGIGSHAPANAWGAIDLAIDSNGDGAADPEGTWEHPIHATHTGVIKTKRNSWPAGNHVWVMNLEYKTGYAHLKKFAVTDGQLVQAGDVIGYVGSSGQSSGPHLDYQVWQKQRGQWVNVDPKDFNALQ